MKLLHLVPALCAVLGITVTPAQAFFILSQGILQTTRLDPIISPGEVSAQ